MKRFMDLKKTISLAVLSVFVVMISMNIGIFWDNVLFVSKMGNPLFYNGIFRWNSIPLESDPGHPPFLATYMAIGWRLFGRSLSTSHWMMFPFIFGLLWQVCSFICYFIKEKSFQFWAFILVIADPTFLSQLVQVNPELIQLFFFFMALNATLQKKVSLKIIGLAFLGIVTYRGMMLCAGIFLIDVLMHIFIREENLKSFFTKQIITTYLIAAIPAVLYLTWRITAKGWISSHPLETWGNAWLFSSVGDFLRNLIRNILVLGQRFIDFGRLIPILFILITLYLKRREIEWVKIKPVLLIIFFSTIVICIISLIIRSPMGHRYFIPSFLSLGLLSFLLINEYKYKRIIYLGLLISLLSGNFIVYSDSYSQGWDASLAHMPYWKLRRNAIEYMDNRHLPVSETASFFPNCTSIDNVDLNGDMRSFISFSGTENYVFYSNVYNLNDDELELLHHNYHILESFNSGKVRVEIMQRNNNVNFSSQYSPN